MNVRVRAWLAQWGPMLPLLLAEGVLWVGFGALLPILSIYFVEHGVDLPMLGVVVAAWPAARVVSEPAFGWLADRVSRRLMMIIGLLASAVFAVMPLFLLGPAAFIAARLLAGLAAAMYDPAARGYIVDANPPEKRGEAFGLYNAAQMAGFMLGPAVGGITVAIVGDPTIVFWVAGVSLVASALLVALRVPELGHARESVKAAVAVEPDDGAIPVEARPSRLLNSLLIAGLALNVGAYFASGTYEVIWSLYLTSLGASV
ncbi:MAG: MFS transporter, partial [Chloroflexota bacterium]